MFAATNIGYYAGIATAGVCSGLSRCQSADRPSRQRVLFLLNYDSTSNKKRRIYLKQHLFSLSAFCLRFCEFRIKITRILKSGKIKYVLRF
jgi:hypothetical protein